MTSIGRFAIIPLSALVIDEQYQRLTRPSRCRELIRTWDPTEFSPIIVNRRTGEYLYHVVDGHHRITVIPMLTP